MQVQVNKIINDYLTAESVQAVSYLYNAPTASGTYMVLTDISDVSVNSKDRLSHGYGRARMQLSIYSSTHATVRNIRTVVLDCIRTTKDETEENVTWLIASDNFSETIYNKDTNRYQCVIDFFVTYIEAQTT